MGIFRFAQYAINWKRNSTNEITQLLHAKTMIKNCRKAQMNCQKLYLVLIILALGSQLFAQNDIEMRQKRSLVIGEVIEFQSRILKEDRTLNIYLPNGYSKDSIKVYPVIYLLDGSIDEDFIHVAGLVQFGSFPWINMIPESIVVGISNVDRRRDFTFPTNNKEDRKDFPTAGGSEIIDDQYHTNSVKTVIGQSLGGLLATEILLKKPALFDHYIIVSPSLWWDDESLLQYKPMRYVNKKSIYVAVGKEGEVMERTAKALYRKLTLHQTINTKVFFGFFEKRDHGDALHLAVYDAFEKIFK